MQADLFLQRALVFALLTVLACVEKLCAIMNLVAVERDWVRITFPQYLGNDD